MSQWSTQHWDSASEGAQRTSKTFVPRSAEEALWTSVRRLGPAGRHLQRDLFALAATTSHNAILTLFSQLLYEIGAAFLPRAGEAPISRAVAARAEAQELMAILANLAAPPHVQSGSAIQAPVVQRQVAPAAPLERTPGRNSLSRPAREQRAADAMPQVVDQARSSLSVSTPGQVAATIGAPLDVANYARLLGFGSTTCVGQYDPAEVPALSRWRTLTDRLLLARPAVADVAQLVAKAKIDAVSSGGTWNACSAAPAVGHAVRVRSPFRSLDQCSNFLEPPLCGMVSQDGEGIAAIIFPELPEVDDKDRWVSKDDFFSLELRCVSSHRGPEVFQSLG